MSNLEAVVDALGVITPYETSRLCGNHWKDNMRRTMHVMVDSLESNTHFCVYTLLMTSVGVSVPEGKAAAGYMDTDGVPLHENVANGL